ncbi:MAG: DUF3047 domain-containing protein [Candidatus Omnitrophica bacterium]|nr:DUF3047 domain-containing protein [Candidatus Omnitrophota bacterium]
MRKNIIFISIGVAVAILLALIMIFSPIPHWLGIKQHANLRDRILRGVAWFDFNQRSKLSGWEEKIFQGRVQYSIKSDRKGTYLDAYSKNAASGIIYWLKFSPSVSPMVSWKWKVIQFPKKSPAPRSDNWWVEKDDYAARFYLIFPRFPFFRLQCLEYVWDEYIPAGTIINNPNFNSLKIIVAESGAKNRGKWITMERNVYDDFKKAFGSTPGDVGAIAIMTDSDNSASTAEAQYNDIEVGYGKQ